MHFQSYDNNPMEIYMFFISYHTERIFHRVTSYNRKSKILGKADSLKIMRKQEVIPRNKSRHV